MRLNKQSLKDVQLGTPALREDVYLAKVESAKVEPNKSGKNQLILTLKIQDEEVIKYDGGGINNANKQLTLWDRVQLEPNDAGTYDQDMIDRRLKQIAIAIYGNEDNVPEDLDSDALPTWTNVVLKIRVKHQPATDKYPAGNNVSAYYPLTEEDGYNG